MKKQLKKLLHKLEKRKQHEESMIGFALGGAQSYATCSGRASAYGDCIREIQSIINSLDKK